MLSVKEAAAILGVSPARVRKLIADNEIPALKVGNAWALEEKDVLNRLSKRPRSGRPRKDAGEAAPSSAERSQRASARLRKAKRLYQDCEAILSAIPDATMIEGAESADEAAFYIAISDFFLQKRQRELIGQGVF